MSSLAHHIFHQLHMVVEEMDQECQPMFMASKVASKPHWPHSYGFGYLQPQCGDRMNVDKRLALNISMDQTILVL